MATSIVELRAKKALQEMRFSFVDRVKQVNLTGDIAQMDVVLEAIKRRTIEIETGRDVWIERINKI